MSAPKKLGPSHEVFNFPDFMRLSLHDRVERLMAAVTTDPAYFGWDTYAFQNTNLRLIEAKPGVTRFEMDITPQLANKAGDLHGGAAATLLDNLTSTAVLTTARPGFMDNGHVSRTLTTSYLRPVPVGSRVSVHCEMLQSGRNTCNVQGQIILNGKVCVSCVHDKVVLKPRPQETANL